MQYSDHAIVLDWFNRREADAFRIIVGRHAGMVYATCRRMLGNDSEAEEVAQECFEVLATVPPQQAPPREIGPWLHGVAVNKSLMRLRAEGRRRKYESRYAAEQPSHTRANWDDVRDLIDEAVAELPEELRGPTVHHFFYGQSHGEIARAAGIPRRTISNRIGKAVELVGETLRKRGLQVSTAALAGMVLGGLSEAAAAPATVMTPLGSVALSQSPGSSGILLAAGSAGMSLQAKLMAVVLAVAALLSVGLGANHVYRRARPNNAALPMVQDPGLPENVAGGSGQPEGETAVSDASDSIAPQRPIGSIAGRVLDGTMTGKGFLAVLTSMINNEPPDKLKSDERFIRPRPGVEIRLGEFAKEGIGPTLRTAVSDDAGRFVFEDVPVGAYSLHLVPPAEACPWRDAKPDNFKHVEVKENEAATVDFSIQNGISIRGRVTDASGTPIRGASVSATPVVTIYWDQSYARVEEKASQSSMTQEDGSYAVHGLVPASIKDAVALVGTGKCAGGVLEITVAAPGYATKHVYTHAVTEALANEAVRACDELRRNPPAAYPEKIPARPASVPLPACDGDALTGLDVALETAATVSGSLVTSQGRSLPNVPLSIHFVDEGDPLKVASDTYAHDNLGERVVIFEGTPFKPYPVLPESITTDVDGRFAFTGLSAGTYRFEALTSRQRKQQARNAPLAIGAGQQVTWLEVVVEDPEDRLTLKGLVVDAGSRQPLSDYEIWVKEVEAPDEATPLTGELKKDEQQRGRFSVVGISPGIALLEVKSPGYGSEQFHVDMRTEVGRETVFPLEREAVLTGRVTVNGEARDTQITAKHVEGWPDPYTGSSKETGEYEIKGLRPGEYYVSTSIGLEGPTRSTQRSLKSSAILVAGKTTQVDFDFTGSASISGTLIAPKDSQSSVSVLAVASADAVPPSGADEYYKLWVAGAWDFRDGETYRISMLPAGTYAVVGSFGQKEDGKYTQLDRQVHMVTLAEGENAEFDFDFSE
ncbi:MAG: sigma-70 family RNA polymerase sigma factor [Candidatus Hydrogenedentales bacterium]|jgi:RNA polymerase sigma factor (sigma-70 family)